MDSLTAYKNLKFDLQATNENEAKLTEEQTDTTNTDGDKENKYPDSSVQKSLAVDFDREEISVKQWFCNRRKKDRKEKNYWPTKEGD